MFTALVVPVLLLGAGASPAETVRITVQEPASPILERVVEIVERHIAARSTVRIIRSGDAELAIALATDPALPREGYRIEDAETGGIRISGADGHAVLYGAGKFLRTSRYDTDSFTPSDWRGASAPNGTFRAIYAATHFNNFYEAAPVDEVCRYLEDLALWGANTVIVHFPTWDFEGYDDSNARRNLEQIRRLLASAKSIGMATGLVQCPNQGFSTMPEGLRATPNRDESKRRGDFGINCCPSNPEGLEYLLNVYAGLFSEFRDTGLDYLVCWPYDEGGCGCETCAPWGANAFPILSERVAALGRKEFPRLKVILSTWVYDVPPSGEWEGLAARLREDSSWLDAIMCDDHFDFPRYPLDHGVPANLPLYNFPEISMWGRSPWGAYGANPLPARYEALWKQTSGKVSGGMPYSEGIFEDMNKVICLQFYWNQDSRAEDTLREYAAFEFSPESVEDVIQAVRLLESSWTERGEESERAYALLQKVDAALPGYARIGWRWRLLYLRALIDSELVRNGGKMEGTTLREAFRELTSMYHAENALRSVKPHEIP